MSTAMAVAQCFAALNMHKDVWRATLFLSPKQVVKATRVRYLGKGRKEDNSFHVTIGRPNYSDRRFIKAYQRAGEPLPTKSAHLKLFPKRRT